VNLLSELYLQAGVIAILILACVFVIAYYVGRRSK
jgi:hypothetical protein